MSAMTFEQAQADIAFLLLRAGHAGSCGFSNARWTGMSSNALVKVAYGGQQDALPHDRSDYAACVRTYMRLPRHRRTEVVRGALMKAREHYLARYPEHITAAARRAKYERDEIDHAAFRKRTKTRRRRA